MMDEAKQGKAKAESSFSYNLFKIAGRVIASVSPFETTCAEIQATETDDTDSAISVSPTVEKPVSLSYNPLTIASNVVGGIITKVSTCSKRAVAHNASIANAAQVKSQQSAKSTTTESKPASGMEKTAESATSQSIIPQTIGQAIAFPVTFPLTVASYAKNGAVYHGKNVAYRVSEIGIVKNTVGGVTQRYNNVLGVFGEYSGRIHDNLELGSGIAVELLPDFAKGSGRRVAGWFLGHPYS